MAGNDPHLGGKLWVMPAILEVFGFSSVLKAYDTFDGGKPWFVWLGYAATGTALLAGGILWAVFRKRIAELWPWYQLRIAKAEVAQILQENSELQERLDTPKELIALPLPAQSRLVKPQHNVQCVGFKVFDDHDGSPITATLFFQNVRVFPDQLIGKFEQPRLRVVYYDNSTGQEIADLVPLMWWDSENGPDEINASGSHAIIASYFKGKWQACEINEPDPSEEYFPQNKYHWIDILAREVLITASLSGGYSNSPNVKIKGVLTLGEDGTASFQRMSD